MFAEFAVDIERETVFWYRHQIAIPISTNRVQYLSYQQGERLKHLSQIVRQGDIDEVRSADPITTDYGKTLTVSKLEDEAIRKNQDVHSKETLKPDNPCEACLMEVDDTCNAFFSVPPVSFILGAWADAPNGYCENLAVNSQFEGRACYDRCNTSASGGGSC